MRLPARFRTGFRRAGLLLAVIGVLAPALAGLARAAVMGPPEAIPAWVMASLCGPADPHADAADPGDRDEGPHHHLVLCPLCPVLSLAGPLLAAVSLPPPARTAADVRMAGPAAAPPARDGLSPGASPRGPPPLV